MRIDESTERYIYVLTYIPKCSLIRAYNFHIFPYMHTQSYCSIHLSRILRRFITIRTLFNTTELIFVMFLLLHLRWFILRLYMDNSQKNTRLVSFFCRNILTNRNEIVKIVTQFIPSNERHTNVTFSATHMNNSKILNLVSITVST